MDAWAISFLFGTYRRGQLAPAGADFGARGTHRRHLLPANDRVNVIPLARSQPRAAAVSESKAGRPLALFPGWRPLARRRTSGETPIHVCCGARNFKRWGVFLSAKRLEDEFKSCWRWIFFYFSKKS